MEMVIGIMRCINCNKGYREFAFYNYNLGLCRHCLNKFEKNRKIEIDESCDKVKHKITCPECGKIYKGLIVDERCKTKNCNVWFFWDSLDCMVFARWLKKDIKVK